MSDKLLIFATIICIILLILMYQIPKKQVELNEDEDKTSTEHFESTLVLFCYAKWCAHCKLIEPRFSKLVKTQPIPNVNFVMVEESQNTYKKYTSSIEGYPTLIVDDNNTIKSYVGGNKVSEALKLFEESI